jgi:heat shock protein beta
VDEPLAEDLDDAVKAEGEDDDEAKVEDEEEKKKETKKVSKTVWDWELMNSVKPIWTRKYVFCKIVFLFFFV